MRIGDLAKRAGVNIQTVRFYEREEVLRQPARTQSGYRSYTDRDLQHVVFIKWCQHLGFTLKEIRQLSVLHDALAASGTADSKPLKDICLMANERLRLIDEKISGLQEMRTNLLQLLSQAGTAPAGECLAEKVLTK